MIGRSFFALAALLFSLAAAQADTVFVDEKDVRFPTCEILIETSDGKAKISRTLSEGRLLHQYVFWDASRKQVESPFQLYLYWRTTKASGLSRAPVIAISLAKSAYGTKRSFAYGSYITAIPVSSTAGDGRAIKYPPLQSDKAKHRRSFEVDAAELAAKFPAQKTVQLIISGPDDKGITGLNLSMDFVREFTMINDKANPIFDKWQKAGGFGCPGIGR